jgi:hypothetical protein
MLVVKLNLKKIGENTLAFAGVSMKEYGRKNMNEGGG